MRTAAVGTLNSVPPMLTGSDAGAPGSSGVQVGHNRYATNATAAIASARATVIGMM